MVSVSPPVLLDSKPGGNVPTVHTLPDVAMIGPLATMDHEQDSPMYTSDGDKLESTTGVQSQTVMLNCFVTFDPVGAVNVTMNG